MVKIRLARAKSSAHDDRRRFQPRPRKKKKKLIKSNPTTSLAQQGGKDEM